MIFSAAAQQAESSVKADEPRDPATQHAESALTTTVTEPIGVSKETTTPESKQVNFQVPEENQEDEDDEDDDENYEDHEYDQSDYYYNEVSNAINFICHIYIISVVEVESFVLQWWIWL